MDIEVPRPKPAPPKVGPHAPKPVEEAKDETTAEERCLCGRFPSQVSEGCVFTMHKRPYVMKPHLTDRPLRENPGLQELRKSMSKSEPKQRPVKRQPRKNKEKN
jgi:hypothetical protein